MTSRPRLYSGGGRVYGLLALALFGVLAAVFITADFGDPAGFSGVESITAAIGYAMFDIQADVVPQGTESFLAAFEIIDIVLVAALAAAVMLARREGEGMGVSMTDGGREQTDRDGGED